jgi:hypothetical protein
MSVVVSCVGGARCERKPSTASLAAFDLKDGEQPIARVERSKANSKNLTTL